MPKRCMTRDGCMTRDDKMDLGGRVGCGTQLVLT